MSNDDGTLRGFDTGATRDTAEGKLDYDGFLSPAVLKQYAKFMNMNRLQSDGKLRDSDNWQKGIPMDVYRSSAYRHWMEFWTEARMPKGMQTRLDLIGPACGLLFNIMGYMHEWLKTHDMVDFDGDEPTVEMRERQAKVANQTHPVGVGTERFQDLYLSETAFDDEDEGDTKGIIWPYEGRHHK